MASSRCKVEKIPHVSDCIYPDSVLYVIVPVSNPVGYQSRYTLAIPTIQRLATHEYVQVLLVELANSNQPHMLTEPGNEFHLQLRANSVLWHKENMLNLAVEHLTRIRPGWQYMAWVDADIAFDNVNIGRDTIKALGLYPIVQMFQTVMNKGPTGAIFDVQDGFAAMYHKNEFRHPGNTKYTFWHPGFAWAYTRAAWKGIGRFIDRGICGAGDHHMALALIGQAHLSFPSTIGNEYKTMVMDWQDRVFSRFRGMIGYVEGTIIHGFHGRFNDRRYRERWEILTKTRFNPWTDIVPNEQGVYEWDTVDSKGCPDPRLPLLLIQYFKVRNEDTIDCPPK